ncbi:MAG: TerB family tellurite resistance protein [Deltaproteobacteria bacterium]|nr:TerB family tellurite resistance protein [Deltaproteobacteria bacterium]
MLNKLSRPQRLQLMKFVCSFAWSDLEVQQEERSFVKKMMGKLELDDTERLQVAGWLEVPPPPEEVDPSAIPAEHRQLFLETMRAVIAADKVLDPDERENLALFEQLLR